ncbi:MAG TPA: BatA and WFA domain-containing protein [Gammaproteobacteria bacterium]|nr:BatA and WFA domain-containing protein [Gammaproteobacteria bacterium]
MSFLAPAFLAGLLAIGLPLWLHRLSAENPNRRPFSSVMFLEAGEPRRVLAKQLQYLLLLAFRIAVLVALVLAFIQPAIWRDPAAAAAGGQRLHVIVVDTSASMAAGDRWDEAVDTAIDLIDSVPAADQVQLIAAGRVFEIVSSATLDKATVRQQVRSLETGVFFVDFGQLTRALDGVLRTAELPAVLHFVTDAQAAGLPTRFADLSPTEPVEIVVHAVGADEPNWSVGSLFGSALTGELAATVTSHAAAAADRTLEIELNGNVVDRQRVTLEPGSEAVVEFAPLTLQSGANRVRVIMQPGDVLAADDARMLALNRPVPHPVLVVSGELGGTGDTRFLTEAMRVLEGLSLEVTAIGESELAEQEFSDYEFVVVADAAAIDGREADRLSRYVESGGGLLLALGPRSPMLSAVPVTGHAFASQATPLGGRAANAVTIGSIETSHPALAGLDTIRAARFMRYAAVEETAADEVLIRLETGDPLLIERGLGDGRLLLYASSLDRQWNDLPREPAFVPFVAGLADHLLGGAGFTNEAALGSTLALAAMGMSGGQIFGPDGESVLRLGGTDVLLDQIGFYELVGGGRTELVAVNFDGRESDLAPAPEQTLARWQGLGRAPEAVEGGSAVREEVLVPLGYWLLLLILAAAIMESGLGNWHLRVRRGLAA